MDAFTIIQASWLENEADLRFIRETVFMREQQVPEELEWDGEDLSAVHLLALDEEKKPIGCARILHDGHIGRMAVLGVWRRRGVGSALLHRAVEAVRAQALHTAFLDAQVYAIPFYERYGFRVEGEEFMDAGISHRHMVLIL